VTALLWTADLGVCGVATGAIAEIC